MVESMNDFSLRRIPSIIFTLPFHYLLGNLFKYGSLRISINYSIVSHRSTPSCLREILSVPLCGK